MAATARQLLDILDYRTRVQGIYTDVRERLDAGDARGGHQVWREARDELYRTHRATPLTTNPDAWGGMHYWDYDPKLSYLVPFDGEAPLEGRDEPEEFVMLPGHKKPWGKAVPVAVLDIGIGKLFATWLHQYGGGFFVAFRDATNGDSTYAGGRYLLDSPKGAWLGEEDGQLRIDLNFAYHPSCARDPSWNCPLALDPPLPAVHAGEKLEQPAWS